jgi:hypothetical protein
MVQTPFLGSTSYLSAFQDEAAPGLSTTGTISLAAEFERWRKDHKYVATRLLKLLSAFAFYKEVITNYYERGQFTIVPAPLVLKSLDELSSGVEANANLGQGIQGIPLPQWQQQQSHLPWPSSDTANNDASNNPFLVTGEGFLDWLDDLALDGTALPESPF